MEGFGSPDDFLRYERRHRAACLVLDVHLGTRSGFDLYESLQRSGVRTPVIFITAHDDELTRERARRAGAVEYLSKPFEDQMVIDAIDRAVALRESGPDGGRRRQGPTLP